MEVSYPARDVFYSQRDRPDTVVRVSVEPGVLGPTPRVVFDLVLVRSLRGETQSKQCTGMQQALSIRMTNLKEPRACRYIYCIYSAFPIEPPELDRSGRD